MITMKNIATKLSRLLSIPLLLCSLATSANAYKEISLEQKVRQADLVLIGEVASVSSKDCMRSNRCANVRPIEILKGKNVGSIRVLLDGEIAEQDPLCCETGKHYLFIIKRIGDYYMSVNGPYGIYKLP